MVAKIRTGEISRLVFFQINQNVRAPEAFAIWLGGGGKNTSSQIKHGETVPLLGAFILKAYLVTGCHAVVRVLPTRRECLSSFWVVDKRKRLAVSWHNLTKVPSLMKTARNRSSLEFPKRLWILLPPLLSPRRKGQVRYSFIHFKCPLHLFHAIFVCAAVTTPDKMCSFL